jgi:hypothetical protein
MAAALPGIVQTPLRIQWAHDLIAGIILAGVPLVSPVESERMRAALDGLCWVLGHAHNTDFADNLERLRARAFAAGRSFPEQPP